MVAWWRQRPMRLIQTNLSEVDAAVDPADFVRSLRDFSANVVLFNVGGIVANYPTELDYHYRNPHLRNDFLGEVLTLAHAEGIRLIARFDFSKVNEAVAADREDWHYKSVQGRSVNYNGQIHVCVNSEYQQRLSLEIMTEVARRYPIDGVFINMHGYVVRDYSGVYHGVCQCANCLSRFRDETGHDRLPVREDDPDDPGYVAYEQFKRRTVAELFERRSAAVKSVNPDIATCNYTPEGTDIFRLESGTHLIHQLPDFSHDASHHVKLVTDTWPGMAVSNAAVHFVDYPMRYAGVSEHLTATRLAQDAVHGGWLDYYVMGSLPRQADRRCFDGVRDVYRFHAEHERYYTGMTPRTDVCLVEPHQSSRYGSMAEFRGLYRILAEDHVLFDVVRDTVLADPAAAERLSRYQAVILPDARMLDDETCANLDRYVASGGKLLVTGASATYDAHGVRRPGFGLDSLGVAHVKERRPRQQGAYFAVRPSDKERLRGFDDLDVVYLYGEFLECVGKPAVESFLAYIPPHMFGPPEKCYYTTVTDAPGILANAFGSGVAAVIPWTVGRHYDEYSNAGHARVVLAGLRDLLGLRPTITTDASPLVELAAHRGDGGAYDLVHAVNLSGRLGTAVHAPLPVRDVTFRIVTDRTPRRVRALRAGTDLSPVVADGTVTVTLGELRLFETVVVEY